MKRYTSRIRICRYKSLINYLIFMRNTILFIIFLILSFVINIIFYYVSDDYRLFLKNLKNEDNLSEEIDLSNVSDENDKSLEIIKSSDKNENIFKDDWEKTITLRKDVNLWKNYKEIISLFTLYDLKELELNTNLFDLTDEYPDNFIEFYSKNLTLYLFPTKTYEEINDIFSILETELPFKVNEINNFWDNSFYINLNEDIDDKFIRMIISNKWVVFWLKIKKNEYNLIKEKLNTLRTN